MILYGRGAFFGSLPRPFGDLNDYPLTVQTAKSVPTLLKKIHQFVSCAVEITTIISQLQSFALTFFCQLKHSPYFYVNDCTLCRG